MDFEHLYLVVAVDESGDIIGVAAWEQASPKDIPHGKTALLLHGIYVDPSCHQHGVGRQLFHAAEEAAVRDHFDGLLVKAQRDAVDFFKAQGMQKLVVENTEQNYANRFWKSVDR
jgi:GNAT superfamily N-acetyltransferase